MIAGFNSKYRFLSNFYPSPLEFEGILYPTVEHAYQAAKTSDLELRRLIAGQPNPGGAKTMGRNVAMREDWEDVKVIIMKRLLEKKFYDNVLVEALLATGTEELIEENYWHDQYWGNCGCFKHLNQPGENHLGRLLMEVRSSLVRQRVF